jgi:hypothetical protein
MPEKAKGTIEELLASTNPREIRKGLTLARETIFVCREYRSTRI